MGCFWVGKYTITRVYPKYSAACYFYPLRLELYLFTTCKCTTAVLLVTIYQILLKWQDGETNFNTFLEAGIQKGGT